MSLLVRRNVLRSMFSIVPRMAKHEGVQVKPFEEIPGPSFGESLRFRYGESSIYKLHLAYSKMYEEFGPLVKEIVNPERTIVHVFDAQDMQKVYENEGEKPTRPSHSALEHYRENHPETYSCSGMISNDGESSLRFRKLFASTLMNTNIVNKYLGVMENVTEDLMARIAAELDANNEVDITPLVYKWSLDTIGAITLNVQFGCLSAEGNEEAMTMLDAVKEIHKYVYLTENFPDPDGNNYRECAKAQKTLESIVQKHMHKAIADIEKGEHGESLLALMLKLKNASKEDAFTMISDMVTGGTDTVSVALTFLLYNLATNPSVQATLREDLKQLPSKTTRVSQIPFDNTYAMKVLKESLRVNPTGIGNGRVIPADLVLSGYRIPAKTPVILQHQVASMQEKYFRDPHIFNPSRWDSPGLRLSRASSPFGGGKRKCVGYMIAKEELTIALSRIIRNFEVSYHHEPVDTINRLVNVPDRPVLLRFTPREN